MTEDLQFAPHMQSSIGAAVSTTMPHLRPTLSPELTLVGPGGRKVTMDPPKTDPPGAGLQMLGPEGVVGIDPRHILRMEPTPGSVDVEPNYLACIEFDLPELPWLFTPARADQGRLRPWLALVVLERADHQPQPGRPLPVVDVAPARLPDPASSWAWAHVQRPAGRAGPLTSRLLCPRRLEQSTPYLACLVPAFEGGRVAGLTDGDQQVDALGDAWQVGGGVVRLPVYHHWEFTTGEAGDFEQLASAVVPLKKDEIAALGGVSVDITEPWRNGEPLRTSDGTRARQTIVVQGVLSLHDPPDDTVDAAAVEDFMTRVADQISRGAEDDVTLPFYGGHHLVRREIDAGETGWPADLNLWPERRIPAALGAEWVRENQEFLMARAWEQVGPVREANRLRARTAFCTEVASSVHRRDIGTLDPAELLRLAGPVNDRVMTDSGLPLRTEIAVSPAPTALADPALHRLVLRSRGPISRRTGVRPASYVARALGGELIPPMPAPVVTAPQATAPLAEEDSDELAARVGSALRSDDSHRAGTVLRVLSAMAVSAEANGFPDQAQALTSAVADPVRRMVGETPEDALAAEGTDGTMPALRLLSLDRAFTATTVAPLVGELAERFGAMSAGPAVNVPVLHHVLASDSMSDDPGSHLLELGVPVDQSALGARLTTALEPGPLLAARLAHQASPEPGFLAAETPAPTDPVMMCPSFPAPLALALKERLPDWFLPGSALIPDNRAVLLKANPEFIAAFMVGANDEINRELRWREYPTDLRGTPFTQFWPRTDGVSDVPPLHTWTPDGALGSHLAAGAGGLDVLLIRGPLVRRYPDMTVAALPPEARHQPGLAEESWQRPVMILNLDEQTAAYAFELPEATVHDWWFVLAENAHRVRFGFDTAETATAQQADEETHEAQPRPPWSDLNWGDVDGGRGFAEIDGRVLPSAGTPTPVSGGRWNAAEVANMALQRPFRIVRSARSLIGDP
ncbi:hypothetical protein GCM10018789_14250 [Streptomyces werraensis]|nr:hypothetical protein GCM10018789_14250 [Streptomyces werraensis]